MQLLFIECYKLYIESMQKAFLDVDSFFTPADLQTLHESKKNEAVEKVISNRKWIQLNSLITQSLQNCLHSVQER